MKDIDIYAPADKAIKAMNRDILRDFGKLKMAKFDEIHLIQSVTVLYREQVQKARKRYYEVAYEAYLLALYLCGLTGKQVYQMADGAITLDWIDGLLEETDLVTLYRFTTEAERKAQRLIETLAGAATAQEQNQTATSGRGNGSKASANGTDIEIDRAIKYWSKQVGQYAIGITDAAVAQAYEDADVDAVQWMTERDARVCSECRVLDGKIFKLDEVPVKPHWHCRCRQVPFKGRTEGEDEKRKED